MANSRTPVGLHGSATGLGTISGPSHGDVDSRFVGAGFATESIGVKLLEIARS